jgi:DAK2 domain fusion protein YloV
LADVVEAARSSAAEALAGTTEQLPALRAAGVVDAGGAGLLLLFASFSQVVDGREIEAPPAPAGQEGRLLDIGEGRAGAGDALAGPGDVGDLRYEVMFFLEASDEAIPAFRAVWEGVGGSIVIVGGDGLYNCHIHTDDVGAAIEAAIEIGQPRQIRVTDLYDQVEEERWVREAAAAGDQHEAPPEPVTCAVVAVAAGEGVKRIFRSLGARQIVAGGQSSNPSTAEILDAISAAPAEEVIVLPNNPNVIAVAEQAAAHSPKKVRVVPTAGTPEGFAALLAYDPEAHVGTNADNMAAAAARVVSGEVVQASRDAVSEAGAVKQGDWLGLSRGSIEVVAPQPASAADAGIALLGTLIVGDHEIVTIIEGEGARAADTRRIVEWLSEHHPDVSAEVHHGGQPLYPYLFSIE